MASPPVVDGASFGRCSAAAFSAPFSASFGSLEPRELMPGAAMAVGFVPRKTGLVQPTKRGIEPTSYVGLRKTMGLK